MNCPANYLYNKLVHEVKGSATSVGTTFHGIMEEFYNLKGAERTWDSISKITEKRIVDDGQEDSADSVRKYVKNYWESPDYLPDKNGKYKPMDHKNLECFTEVFMKPQGIKPLGYPLEAPIYVKIDRIDVREEGIFIIDYKTGWGDPDPWIVNSYVPQCIFYKWAVEEEYGQEVAGVLLSCPGADDVHQRYVKTRANSLVAQSKVIQECVDFLKSAQSVRQSKEFPTRKMRYCGSCGLKKYCNTYKAAYKIEDDPNVDYENIPVVYDYDPEEYYESIIEHNKKDAKE
jgi:hypothetical protein